MYPRDIYDIKKLLKKHGIKLSMTRLKIYEYLALHDSHPTAEEIYKDLSENFISIAKATVYNTLNLFVDKGLINIVRVENVELRYDVDMEFHSHFKCLKCGKLYNVDFDISKHNINGLEGFDLIEYHSHIKGYCPKCNI